MKRYLCGFYLCVVALFFSSAVTAEAASLYIDPGRTSLFRGDAITMSIRLDIDEDQEECVNAVDAVLTYSTNIEPVDVSIGDSIFNIWVEQPIINKQDRTVTFAGGIPNGYCGRVSGDPRLTNVLAKVIFRSPGFSIGGSDDSIARIEFVDTSTAYLNDGRGTKALLKTYGAEITLDDKAGKAIINPWQEEVESDVLPPEEFSITLHKDKRAFSQRYYIVFNTSDKQTGVDHYEVIEEPVSDFGAFKWGGADAPWVVTRSPYVLNDQTLNSTIRVKAVDKAGNEYIATYVPDDALNSLSPQLRTTIVLGVGSLLIIAFVFLISWTYLKKRKKQNVSEQENHNDVESEYGSYN